MTLNDAGKSAVAGKRRIRQVDFRQADDDYTRTWRMVAGGYVLVQAHHLQEYCYLDEGAGRCAAKAR